MITSPYVIIPARLQLQLLREMSSSRPMVTLNVTRLLSSSYMITLNVKENVTIQPITFITKH